MAGNCGTGMGVGSSFLLTLTYEASILWVPDADTFEKTLMLGKIESKRIRGQKKMRWLEGIIDSMDMNLCKLGEIVKDRETASHGIAKSRT